MKRLSRKISKQENLHDQIVDEILPNFAQKLKVEKVISSYDRTPFKIQLFEDWAHFAIVPDLIVYLPTGEKVLVEVANPKEPKSLLMCACFLCKVVSSKNLIRSLCALLYMHG